MTLKTAGDFEVKIAWEGHHDFDLIVYKGHFEAHANPPSSAQVGRSDSRVRNGERVVVPDAAADEYTVRIVYFRVVDSGYRGSATFLDSDVVFAGQELEFGPAAIVSAHFLGTEPMVTMERRIPGSLDGAIDPDRIFVDWPLTSRGQIGQVSRSLDGGQSFRLLFDPGCPERSRPGCLMGGGGDTITEVDLIDGTLYFADQAVVLASESLASSTDNGDTFPKTRQFTIANQTTVTDRQWLAPVNGVPISVGPRAVKAFLAYHVPFEGQYIHGIDEAGVPIPQPVPQLTGVVQSGFPRVDTSEGPGRGWIYQPYLDFGTEGLVVKVATAPGPDYPRPDQWSATTVTTDVITNFAWLDIDSAGNAYLVWAGEDGAVYYSASPIENRANNPAVEGGRPGSFWTPQVRLTPPEIKSSVFAEVVAGDRGRIAITYAGSGDFAGLPDGAPSDAGWHTYAAVITGALQEGGPPVVTTGRVSHRPIHKGDICTGGLLFCDTGDRSLADMIDIGVDEDGRIGVVFADNNNSLPLQNDSEKARPFAHFAKLSSGPSLFADKPPIEVALPSDGADEAGDATWPNTAGASNLPAMDLLGADLSIEEDEVVARLDLANASSETLQQAFASFKESSTAIQPPERLHHMLRFATADDVYHLSMEAGADGTPRFFGGRLDVNDALRAGDSLVGAAYHSDDQMTVTGSIEGNTLVMRAAAKSFGIAEGTEVFSVTGFTMAGPAEEDVAVLRPMRTVDATPPFDATLSPEPVQTTLTYTGDGEGKVGGTAEVSAWLATADGSPLAGRTISFSRGGKEAAAVTGDDGVASTTLKITGPPGSGLPVVVTFDGDASFLPVSIEASFTAHTGTPKAPRGAI